MDDILDFGRIILVVAGALSIAIFVRVARLPDRAADGRVAADRRRGRLGALGSARGPVTFQDVQRVATLALIAILFDGGTSIGLKRFRYGRRTDHDPRRPRDLCHRPPRRRRGPLPLGFDWTVSLLIGAALAPTDPAVTFSVLAGKEVEGRSGTILEGESGFNDPVGIALMIGMIELATHPSAGIADVAWEFLREMGVGLAVGAVAGVVMLQALRRVPLPDGSLYPLAVSSAPASSTAWPLLRTDPGSSPCSSPGS